ncbi:MAG: TolC family protein [Deltaproteobacteria bacterium]|nr:TolC family protein [Deltaproteobacteria bacterium]
MEHRGKTLPLWTGFYLAACLVFSTVIATAGEVAVPAPQGSASPGAAAGAKVLKLEEAVAVALENHPRIRAAKEKVGAQNAVLGQQMSAYYPTVSLSNSYRTTRDRSSRRGRAWTRLAIPIERPWKRWSWR